MITKCTSDMLVFHVSCKQLNHFTFLPIYVFIYTQLNTEQSLIHWFNNTTISTHDMQK